MKIVALTNIEHNKVEYLKGAEIPADSFGMRKDALEQEFSELDRLIQAGAVMVQDEPAQEEPKKAKKAKA